MCVCVCACVCALNCRASGGRGVSECQRGQKMMWGSRFVWRRGCGGGVCVCVCVCVCVLGVWREGSMNICIVCYLLFVSILFVVAFCSCPDLEAYHICQCECRVFVCVCVCACACPCVSVSVSVCECVCVCVCVCERN